MTEPTPSTRGGGWVVGQFVILALILVVGYAESGHYPGHPVSSVVTLLSALAAAFFGWRGFRDLGSNLTPYPKPLDDAQLVTTGVYGIVRHPIYTAVLSGALAYSTFQHSWYALVGTVALAVWFEYKSRREEAFLRIQFPAYADYAQRVKKFIPGVL